MSPLHVDPAVLRLLAVRCRAWSDDLAATAPQVNDGSAFATAIAVREVHSQRDAVAATLANRMRETAALLDDTARRYRSEDADSAMALGDPRP